MMLVVYTGPLFLTERNGAIAHGCEEKDMSDLFAEARLLHC